MPVQFTTDQEKRIRLYFRISILIKGAISLAEIVAGIIVIFVPLSYLVSPMVNFANAELAEEPGDFIATHLLHLSQEAALVSGTFVAIYLLSRGLVKVGLIAALLKNQLWAYPASLVVLGLFVAYQIYQIVTTGAAVVVGLTIFDLIVMYFIWREYQVLKFEAHA